MRAALETIGVQAIAPGPEPGVAMTPVIGDSLRVRDSEAASLVDVMTNFQLDGDLRITSPLIHDNLVGINFRTTRHQISLGYVNNSLSMPVPQKLTPQDTLQVNAVGSTVAGDTDVGALQMMYDDLAGVDANLIDVKELMSRAEHVFSPRVQVIASTAGWTGTVDITALDDQLKANREYAWIGTTKRGIAVDALALGIISPDWGNLRIGAPLQGDTRTQTRYFMDLSNEMGEPLIPVLNASQKSNVLISLLTNENAETVNASLLLVLLKDKKARSRRR